MYACVSMMCMQLSDSSRNKEGALGEGIQGDGLSLIHVCRPKEVSGEEV